MDRKLYIESFQKVLYKFSLFEEQWEQFEKEYGSENDFFSYIDCKVVDLSKDLHWLRKTRPKKSE